MYFDLEYGGDTFLLILGICTQNNFEVSQFRTNYLTNSMELNITRETTDCAATHEIPSTSWNLKVHYRIHKSRPLLLVLS
jgi:hypothetical protein